MTRAQEQADDPAWARLSSRVVYESPWFEVRCDQVVRPDGERDVYQHVRTPGAVTVLALDEDDSVVFTRQWIYTHHSRQLRLPSGGIDFSDPDPLAAARRELADETGLIAGRWKSLGKIHSADSLSNHVEHAFLATVLEAGEQRLEPGEGDLEVCRLPFAEAIGLVLASQVSHSASAYALLALAARRCRPHALP